MGFLEILTLIFITLKLIKVIKWSWLLVLMPEIIAIVIYLIIFTIVIFSGNKNYKI